MAQNLTHTEARNYPLSNGTTVDLVALVSSRKPESWVQATEVQPVGTVVYAYAMGELRRGVVVKNTPTKTMVALTTAAAAAPGGTVRVQTATELHTTVYVAPAPVVETPAEEPAVVAEEELVPLTVDVEGLTRLLQTPDADLPLLPAGRELVRISDLPDLSPLTLHRQACKVDNMNNTSETATETTPAETTPAETTERHTGSTVVKLIEKVWDRIRADHPEIPEIVVTTGSGEGVKWGHFRPNSWRLADDGTKLHEFFLASEALAKSPAQVLQTTIHEAAHALSMVREVKDTSRQGRWHNAAFKKTAEELGLEHKGASADKSHGFSFVTLTAATKAKYADLLAELEQELKLTGLLPFWLGGSDQGGEDERGGEKITGKPTKGQGEGETKSGPVKAVCDCEEPVIIRISQKVMDMGVVRCDACESLFHRP